MSLCSGVDGLKKARTPIRNIKMAPNPIYSGAHISWHKYIFSHEICPKWSKSCPILFTAAENALTHFTSNSLTN